MTETLRYEDAAEIRSVTLDGWYCKKCGRYWGDSEHSARYCCSTDMPCDCGNRITQMPKYYIVCESCRRKNDDQRWAEMERVEWDGETPLCEWGGDRYYFDEDDLREAVAKHLAQGFAIDTFRVVLCQPSSPGLFEMVEFLQDCLPQDYYADSSFDAIDKVVNDWIASKMPFAWDPTGNAISSASLPIPDAAEIEEWREAI